MWKHSWQIFLPFLHRRLLPSLPTWVTMPFMVATLLVFHTLISNRWIHPALYCVKKCIAIQKVILISFLTYVEEVCSRILFKTAAEIDFLHLQLPASYHWTYLIQRISYNNYMPLSRPESELLLFSSQTRSEMMWLNGRVVVRSSRNPYQDTVPEIA